MNWKRLSTILLIAVALGSLALVLVSTSKQVVKADDEKDHESVVLNSTGTSGYKVAGWNSTADDGTITAFTAIPAGKRLVITDLEFADISKEATIGAYTFCNLLGDKGGSLMYAFGLGDNANPNASPNANVFGSTHAGTGVKLTYVPIVSCYNSGLTPSSQLPTVNVTLRGYLEPKW